MSENIKITYATIMTVKGQYPYHEEHLQKARKAENIQPHQSLQECKGNSKQLLWTTNVVLQATKLFVFKDNSSCETGTPFLKAMFPTFHLFLLLLEILRDMPKIYLQACSLHFYYFLYYLKYFNNITNSQNFNSKTRNSLTL